MLKTFSFVMSLFVLLSSSQILHANNIKKEVLENKVKNKGERALKRFKKIDKNNNGSISEKEFLDHAVYKFRKKDKNKDRKISKKEFSKTLR